MALITWQSDYLAHLNLVAGDADVVTSLIDAAGAAINKYTKRDLESAERDRIFPVHAGGVVYLGAYPVDHVARVMSQTVTGLTLSCSAEVATVSVSDAALKLNKVSSGTRTTSTLALATYTTLNSLATAINLVAGWTATVSTGLGAYPSDDLLSGVNINATSVAQLPLWKDTTGDYRVDNDRGLLYVSGSAQSWFWLDGDTLVPSRCRVVWTGGYSTIPADLQRACSEIVSNMFDERESLLQGETLGEYAYTLASTNISRLPVTTQRILASYRDRIV